MLVPRSTNLPGVPPSHSLHPIAGKLAAPTLLIVVWARARSRRAPRAPRLSAPSPRHGSGGLRGCPCGRGRCRRHPAGCSHAEHPCHAGWCRASPPPPAPAPHRIRQRDGASPAPRSPGHRPGREGVGDQGARLAEINHGSSFRGTDGSAGALCLAQGRVNPRRRSSTCSSEPLWGLRSYSPSLRSTARLHRPLAGAAGVGVTAPLTHPGPTRTRREPTTAQGLGSIVLRTTAGPTIGQACECTGAPTTVGPSLGEPIGRWLLAASTGRAFGCPDQARAPTIDRPSEVLAQEIALGTGGASRSETPLT